MGQTIKRGRRGSSDGGDALVSIAEGLASKVPKLVATDKAMLLRALHELLDGPDETARRVRSRMQHYLIEVAERQMSAFVGESVEKFLTTERAAELMQCSRPYVAMLIDNGKLPGATVTRGGHRRVPETAVRDWIKARDAKSRTSNFRAAAAKDGMYDIPESEFAPESSER